MESELRNAISAVLIVKDGEKTLDRCLKSIAEVDEIVVLINQTTDRSAEIARQHTSRVIVVPDQAVQTRTPEGEMKFDFAMARNLALSYARQDWVLTIDADEICHPGFVGLVRKAIPKHPAVSLFEVKFILAQDGSWVSKPKVFRRKMYFWKSRIHEKLEPKSLYCRSLFLYEGPVMEHLPVSEAEKEARRAQNLELLRVSVKEEPEYIRNARQLGMELFARENYREALKWLELYIQSGVGGALDRSETLLHMGRCYSGIGVLEDALKYFDLAIAEAPYRREPLYFQGLAIVKEARTVKDMERAIELFKRCMEIPRSMKPNWFLDIENVWDDTYPKEALAFCEGQILMARKKMEGASS
jgi:glycosyltransferase involved in cell wall biosynthesis